MRPGGSQLVPGIIVIIGKVAFLAALYGFLFAVFRGLVAASVPERLSLRASAPPRNEPAAPAGGRLEQGPLGAGAVTLHPPVAAVTSPAATLAPVLAPVATPVATLRSVAEALAEEPSAPVKAAPEADAGAASEAEGVPDAFVAPPAEPVGAPEPAAAVEPPPLLLIPDEPVNAAAPPPGKLVVLSGSEVGLPSGQTISLDGVFTLGRADDNALVLADRFVSGRHAEVFARGERYVLRDLGSTNGTFRNGARVTGECVLSDGDRIGVGTSVFAFREGEGA